MKCDNCGISIPELPENASYEEMLCDSCLAIYEKNSAENPIPLETKKLPGTFDCAQQVYFPKD